MIEITVYNGHQVVQDFVSYCLEQLGVQPDFLEIYESENGVSYVIDDVEENKYSVGIVGQDRDPYQVFCSIGHELVHVKQFVFQGLADLLDECEIPYEKRWWEQEAKEVGRKLAEDFINEFYRLG